MYKEKLEWNAFAKFLSDASRIERYDHTSIEDWKEWLVYKTALGAGQKMGTIDVLTLDSNSQQHFNEAWPWYFQFHKIIWGE